MNLAHFPADSVGFSDHRFVSILALDPHHRNISRAVLFFSVMFTHFPEGKKFNLAPFPDGSPLLRLVIALQMRASRSHACHEMVTISVAATGRQG